MSVLYKCYATKMQVPPKKHLKVRGGITSPQELKKEPRRYLVQTQRGFLNVHSEPGDPYRSDNVVGRLFEGDIVLGIREQGQWLLHEAGWSIRFHGGFEWLKPLDDSNG